MTNTPPRSSLSTIGGWPNRTADRLNAQLAANAGAEDGAGGTEEAKNALIEEGVSKGMGMMAGIGATLPEGQPLIRAHHGSMSKEVRLMLEQDLKAGRLPALIGTSSLELGIDIGAVDLVLQYQSPKTVAQGLQRVGRAGHLVGQTSRGRIFPTHSEDIMEAAAVAGGMLRGEVEPTHTPRNVLDVLAQQIVAIVGVEETWSVDALYTLVRGAYAYQDLTQRAFHAVLDMLAGRFPSQSHRNLRARLVWDRVNNQVAALPGSRLLALTNGGAITDRGAFGAYLNDGKTKLGELDEEFVYETRVGDTLMLGSQVWRVVDLTDDRVIVADAAGATPRMPFWRGDFPWRPHDLGRRVGAFRRAVAARLTAICNELGLETYRGVHTVRDSGPVQALLEWLRTDYALDANSAWHVVDYVSKQLDHAGAISSDRTVLVEVFDDALGDPRMVIQAPFGGRVNGLWALALAGALRKRTDVNVEVQTNDEGILLRFPDADAEFPLDLVTEMGAAEAREYILEELPNSAVFGAQFRQNAARALLLPGARGGKRTPFWLQRLRAKDLLQVVRQFEDFPIVAETYRDCLEEVMDLPGLEQVLGAIQQGEIEVVAFESITPSPVAHSLIWDFIEFYMYEWDAPKAERQLQTLAVNRELLQDLLQDVDLSDLLRAEAVEQVRSQLQRTALTALARTAEELANLFQNLGDLSSTEIAARATVDPAPWIGQLAGRQRIVLLPIPTVPSVEASVEEGIEENIQERWVNAEYVAEYVAAFDLDRADLSTEQEADSRDDACQRILSRYLHQAGPVTRDAILARYAFPTDWLDDELARRLDERQIAHGHFTPDAPPNTTARTGGAPNGAAQRTEEFIDRHTLEQMHRRTLSILRKEVRPVPFSTYADFLTRWQHLHPATRLTGPGALTQVLQQLRAIPVVGRIWARDLLPLRLVGYNEEEFHALCQQGELIWVGSGGVDPRRGRIRFFFRGEGRTYLEPAPADLTAFNDDAQRVYEFLQGEGAVFLADMRDGLELTSQAAETALTELAMAGLVTNDSLVALWQLVGQGAERATTATTAPTQQRVGSSLEAQLAARRGHRQKPQGGRLQRPSRSELQAARQRVQHRLAQTAESAVPTAASNIGRWALVHRFGVLGKTLPLEEQVARQGRQLLARYGVVTRETLNNETGAWEWGLIYRELQRLEIRGEVRRGLFVQGLPGLQFALPEVVEQLRTLAGDAGSGVGPEDERDAIVLMNACDPANLYGPASDNAPKRTGGEPLTFARIPSTWVALRRGLPILLIEDSGAQLTTVEGSDAGQIAHALTCWLHHLAGFASRITVKQWNGAPILESAGQPLLEANGFYRDYPGMTWERKW